MEPHHKSNVQRAALGYGELSLSLPRVSCAIHIPPFTVDSMVNGELPRQISHVRAQITRDPQANESGNGGHHYQPQRSTRMIWLALIAVILFALAIGVIVGMYLNDG